jgi:hypothetical protein
MSKKTIVSVQTTLTYDDGTSDSFTVQQGELRSPFAPGGKLILSAPASPTGAEIAANPGQYDGDPGSDPTLGWAPQYWDGAFLPPYPPGQRMCDMCRADPDLARAVWRKNLGAPLDESRLTAAQRKRCGL